MAPHSQDSPSQQLRSGTLGLGFIVFFVISAAGPLTAIAGGYPIAILLGNGAGTPALAVLALLILLAFAAGYTAMARHFTHAGGFYALIANGLGGTTGGGAAAVAMLGYNAMQVALYGLFGAVVSGFVSTHFGVTLPWWLYGALALASIAVLGYRNIDLSAKLLSVLVVGEYLVVLVLDVAILRAGGNAGLVSAPWRPSVVMSGTPAIGLLFAFATFIGFEATTLYSEEAKDPERTIPLATYLSVLLIGGFYAFSLYCIVIGAGADTIVQQIAALQDPTMLLYVLSDQYAGHGLTIAISLLFITSVYAALLAFHNAAARYFFAAGREGLLAPKLGYVHAVYRSPHAGSVLQSVIGVVVLAVFAVLGADPVLVMFSWLSNIATLCVLLLMVLTSLAVMAWFRRHGSQGRWLRVQCLPAVSGLLLALVLAMAIRHFAVLTGASESLSQAMACVPFACFAAGCLMATRLKRRNPIQFCQLGRTRVQA